MAAAPHRAPTRHEPDHPADPGGAAAPALLDHLAEELAREYVRLMEQAARDDAGSISPTTPEDL